MYPDVLMWLQGFLEARFPSSDVHVAQTAQQALHRFLRNQLDTSRLPADWQSWDVKIDIIGWVYQQREMKLAIVECKNTPITLTHLSQLLGYSRVIQPEYAFLLSPFGVASLLQRLLVTHNRQDILNYSITPGSHSRSLILARWDATAKTIDHSSIITGDDNTSRI